MVDDLVRGVLLPQDVELDVALKDGCLWTLDNRRVLALDIGRQNRGDITITITINITITTITNTITITITL